MNATDAHHSFVPNKIKLTVRNLRTHSVVIPVSLARRQASGTPVGTGDYADERVLVISQDQTVKDTDSGSQGWPELSSGVRGSPRGSPCAPAASTCASVASARAYALAHLVSIRN